MTDGEYEAAVHAEAMAWRTAMLREPNLLERSAKGVQTRINRIIPERVHQAITAAVGGMVQAMLFGSHHTTMKPLVDGSLAERETRVRARIAAYRAGAAAEGGIAGAGGFVLALADFPAFLAIKMKLLFEIAALYGRSGESFKERLFLLTVFQLAFSSPLHRRRIVETLDSWDARTDLPASPADFDWRAFQQAYRDYIDLAKLAQLLPVVGAPVGAYVNWRMTGDLGRAAMNGYRLRWFETAGLSGEGAALAGLA